MPRSLFKIRTTVFTLHFLVVLTLVLTRKFHVSRFVADILGVSALFVLGALFFPGLSYSYTSFIFQSIQIVLHILGTIIQGRLLIMHIESTPSTWLTSVFLWFVLLIIAHSPHFHMYHILLFIVFSGKVGFRLVSNFSFMYTKKVLSRTTPNTERENSKIPLLLYVCSLYCMIYYLHFFFCKSKRESKIEKDIGDKGITVYLNMRREKIC